MIDRITTLTENQQDNVQGVIARIKLFTGCTDKMVEQARKPVVSDKSKESAEITNNQNEAEQAYIGDKRISDALQLTTKNSKTEIKEEVIVSRVQEVLDRKSDWDSRIKHLVIPFFIRSQKIYGWDLDEFQERLNQLDTKINHITFEQIEDLATMGVTSGDKIKLNNKVFFNKKRCNGISIYRI